MSTSSDSTGVVSKVIGNDQFAMLVFFGIAVLIAVVFALDREFIVPLVFFAVIELLILYSLFKIVRDAIVTARV